MRVPAAGQERAAHPARDAAGRWIVGLSACGLALVVACPSAETGPAADGPAQQVLLPILGPRLVLSGPPSERTRVPSPTLDATRETTATQGPPSSTPTAACARLAERLSVTTNSVGAAIRANDEYHPLPLAARDDGGVLVAWREASAARVRVGAFDEDGRLEGVPLSFDGEEVHADGGAMAVVADDPRIFSPRYCRGPNTPDKPLCASLDLWRFDGTGRTLWRTRRSRMASRSRPQARARPVRMSREVARGRRGATPRRRRRRPAVRRGPQLRRAEARCGTDGRERDPWPGPSHASSSLPHRLLASHA